MAMASYHYCSPTTSPLNELRLARAARSKKRGWTTSSPLTAYPISLSEPVSNGFVLRAGLNESSSSSWVESQLQETTAIQTSVWKWRGYSIRYQYSGDDGPALVLIHGFGANSEHWRKNIPALARSHRVFAIDPYWLRINDFCSEVVKDGAFFICNSIGGLVGLQAAVWKPHLCKGIMLFNISLRMLHIKKQPWFGRPFIRGFQNLLRNTDVGKLFFKGVATPESIKNILCQCYYDTSQVTDELVQIILQPGLLPGAVDVFLEFICYSDGPLPEELLPEVKCPVLIGWGDKDPWEPIELGKAYGNFDSVEEFVVLPDVGHCPQDEAPHLVNPLVEAFVARHTAISSEVPS
ncbi:unnamed protein product [Rhodiola kirilowii]